MRPCKLILTLLAVPFAGIAVAQSELPPDAPAPGQVGRTAEDVVFSMPHIEKVPAPQQQQALHVDSVRAFRLLEGTHAGKPGDLLLAFEGGGFVGTSTNPTVQLAGDELSVDDTLMDAEGSRLFALVSPENAKRMSQLDLREIIVANPGGLAQQAGMRVSLKTDPKSLAPSNADLPGARLLYVDGAFVLEPAEQ